MRRTLNFFKLKTFLYYFGIIKDRMDAGERMNVSREIMFTHFTHVTFNIPHNKEHGKVQ